MGVPVSTFVLVHGKGGGSWIWDPVVELLRDEGHTADAPTLVGAGPRAREGTRDTNLTTHVEQVVSLVEDADDPRVVLVGHSYGGLVAAGVAATVPNRIAELIFVDALLVNKGQCAFDAFYPGVADEQRALAGNTREGWKLPPLTFEQVGGMGSVEPGIDLADVERALHEGRGTHPLGSFEEPVWWDASSLAGVSRRYIIGTDKPSPMREHVAAHVVELREAGFRVDDLPTGHFPMRTMPRALTALLVHSGDSSDDA